MQLSRQDIDTASEMIGLREGGYRIRESYNSRNGVTGAGVDLLDPSKLIEFMVSLGLVLAGQGRHGLAMTVAQRTKTDLMGFGVAVNWPGVELAA
jgi:hypothetical protein